SSPPANPPSTRTATGTSAPLPSGALSAGVAAAEQVPAVEVVPTTVETDLDHVTGELVERRVELVELAGVRDAPSVGLLQRVAVHVRAVEHAPVHADPSVVRSGLAHVSCGAAQLQVCHTHVRESERAG